jgi:hypothetical protein
MKLAGLAVAGALFAGCASSGVTTAAEAKGEKSAPTAADAAILGALPESAIPKGECGMVLWTLDEDRPAPVFRYVVQKNAEIAINGKLTKLSLQEAEGAGGFGVHETQKFVDESGLVVDVEARFSLGFDGGSYLERGVIRLASASGWRTIVPAAGIAGCRGE